MRKIVLLTIIIAAAMAGLYAGYLTSREKPQLPQGPTIFISFLDVERGGGCLIRTPEGQCALIDPGPPETATQLTTYLRQKGIDQLKIILTNSNSSRTGAVDHLVNLFNVTDIIFNQKLAHTPPFNKSGEPKIKVCTMSSGNVIHLSGSTKLAVLPAHRRMLDKSDGISDNISSVLKLSFGDLKVLLCSDIRPMTEAYLVKSSAKIESDIVFLPRNPRYNSDSLEFLSRIRPSYCILPSGGRFGSPSAALLRRLDIKNSGAYIYRTDKDGTIEVVADGHHVLVTKNGGGNE